MKVSRDRIHGTNNDKIRKDMDRTLTASSLYQHHDIRHGALERVMARCWRAANQLPFGIAEGNNHLCTHAASEPTNMLESVQ